MWQHYAKVSLDQPRLGVERADNAAGGVGPLQPRCTDLVQDQDVGKLDLVDEELDQRALVGCVASLASVAQEVMALVVGEEVGGVNNRDHRVEPCHLEEAVLGAVTELERGGDGQRLGDPGRFDQEVVEAPRLGEPAHLLEEVVAQRTADTTIGELDEGLLRRLRSAPPERMRSASMFISDMSLTITAIFSPERLRRR